MVIIEQGFTKTTDGEVYNKIAIVRTSPSEAEVQTISGPPDTIQSSRPATPNEYTRLVIHEQRQQQRTERNNAQTRLEAWASTLENWALDADNVTANWDAATSAQKDQWIKTTINRFGILSEHLADLLLFIEAKRE